MKLFVLCFISAAGLAATASAQMVSDHDRQDALRHYRAGEQALRHEAFDEAGREFQLAVKLDPRLELAHYGLGQVGMSTKHYAAAIRSFTNCREAYLTNAADALLDQSAARQRLDDRIRALEDAKNGFEMGIASTANTQASINILAMQINQLKYDRGHGDANNPGKVPAWISVALGSAFFRTDAFPDAEREFRAALSSEPKLGEAHNNLAVVLMLTKRYDESQLEVKAAEAAGFKVNQQFKDDLKRAMGK